MNWFATAFQKKTEASNPPAGVARPQGYLSMSVRVDGLYSSVKSASLYSWTDPICILMSPKLPPSYARSRA